MRIGFQDFSITILTKILGLLTVLGTQSCLAWVLGPSGRGSYAVCLIFTVILTLVFLVGCESACVYFVAAKKFTVSQGFLYACIYSSIGSLLAMVTGLILLQFPFEFFAKATISQFHISIISIPFGIFSTVLLRLLIALKEITCFAVASLVSAFSNLIFTLILVLVFPFGVEGALFANILSGLVAVLICVYLLKSRFDLTWVRPDWAGMKKILVYGSKYYIGKISNQANVQMGTIIMAFFTTAAEIGMFSIAMRLMTQVMIIPDSLNKVLTPRIAGDREGRKVLVAECFRLTVLSCGMLFFLIAILARPIVVVLFSPAFLPSVPLIQVLAVGMTLRCGSKMLEPYLLGINRPGTASLSVAVGAVVNILLLYLLIPRMGMMGAALGVVGSHLASLFILCLAFLRQSGFKLWDMLRPRSSDFDMVEHAVKDVLKSLSHKSQPKKGNNSP